MKKVITMKMIINFILLLVCVVSSLILVSYSILGVHHEIFGAENTSKLLEILHIPLSYNQTIGVGFISLAVMLVTYIIRKILYDTKINDETTHTNNKIKLIIIFIVITFFIRTTSLYKNILATYSCAIFLF